MKIEQVLLKLMKKAARRNEIPVAAVIVHNERIISKAYNRRYNTKNVLNHAEIIAIRKASRRLGDWRLDNCILYTTMYPCNMCKEVILSSRIKKVVYFMPKNKHIESKADFIYFDSPFVKTMKEIYYKTFKKMRKNQ